MKKCITIISVILLFLGLASGCGQKDTTPADNSPTTLTEDEDYPSGLQVELYAYDATDDQQYITIYELAVGEDVTAENIIKAYQTQVMEGVYGTAVQINEVRLVQGTPNRLYIDFNASSIEILTLEEGSEGNYFGGLAASITANLPEIVEIYYTMDGGDFIVGHLWFGKDEPFWTEHEEPLEE